METIAPGPRNCILLRETETDHQGDTPAGSSEFGGGQIIKI